MEGGRGSSATHHHVITDIPDLIKNVEFCTIRLQVLVVSWVHLFYSEEGIYVKKAAISAVLLKAI